MLENARIRLAGMEALLLLCFIALLVGLLSGSVIIFFRFLIEGVQSFIFPHGIPEKFDNLPLAVRILLPVCASIGLYLVLTWVPAAYRATGIVHVIERFNFHQGYLSWRNALTQFSGGLIALIAGFSVGREGPSVHLGAACGSGLGQLLRLPNNSLRVLVACGVSAGIAASFYTPLAGVMFCIEVIMIEYSLNTLVPIVLSAVIGAVMTDVFFGDGTVFMVPHFLVQNFAIELPIFILLGITIGVLAKFFIIGLSWVTRISSTWPLFQRLFLAGSLTGLFGALLPVILGSGYDSVNLMLVGEISLVLLLQITLFKCIVSFTTVGLGVPAGIIGPLFMIGAAAGGAVGIIASYFFEVNEISSIGLYAMLGMGAMMSATLQAPLAGLIALLELTGNPNLILPEMLVIVIANLVVCSRPWKQQSVFMTLLQARGLNVRDDPIAQALRRVGVASVMERHIIKQPRYISFTEAQTCLQVMPIWIIVEEVFEEEICRNNLLLATDLAHFVATHPDVETIDLLALPAKRLQLAPIALQATLQEASHALQHQEAEALYIVRHEFSRREHIYGVVTQDKIQSVYQ